MSLLSHTLHLSTAARAQNSFPVRQIRLAAPTRPLRRQAARAMTEDDVPKTFTPKSFKYTHLWVSKDGETHIKENNMANFDLMSVQGAPQWKKMSPKPIKATFTELEVGNTQPPHPCPGPQLVIVISGSWYVITSDGTRREFKAGEVLWQDNSDKTPADKVGKHRSGVVGDVPCQQLMVEVDWTPEVDNPGSLG